MRLVVFGSWEHIDVPTSGGPIRIFNILKRLADEGHTINYFMLTNKNRDYMLNNFCVHEIAYPKIVNAISNMRILQNILKLLKSPNAFKILMTISPYLAIRSQAYISKADVVWVNYSVNIFPLLCARIQKKLSVLDTHGLSQTLIGTSKEDLSLIAYLSRSFLFNFIDNMAYSIANKIIVTSDHEKHIFQKITHKNLQKLRVIENGVDDDEFKPNEKGRNEIRVRFGIPENAIVLMFLGYMNHLPNLKAAEYILNNLIPSLTITNYNIWVIIVGDYSELSISSLPARVILTGEVKDVANYVNAADICLAPLTIGTGIKTKVLAYMACGKIVVSTPIGVEGLDVTDGKEVLISSIDDFTAKVGFAINNFHSLSDIRKKAREFASKNYSWNIIVNKANGILKEIHTRDV